MNQVRAAVAYAGAAWWPGFGVMGPLLPAGDVEEWRPWEIQESWNGRLSDLRRLSYDDRGRLIAESRFGHDGVWVDDTRWMWTGDGAMSAWITCRYAPNCEAHISKWTVDEFGRPWMRESLGYETEILALLRPGLMQLTRRSVSDEHIVDRTTWWLDRRGRPSRSVREDGDPPALAIEERYRWNGSRSTIRGRASIGDRGRSIERWVRDAGGRSVSRTVRAAPAVAGQRGWRIRGVATFVATTDWERDPDGRLRAVVSTDGYRAEWRYRCDGSPAG